MMEEIERELKEQLTEAFEGSKNNMATAELVKQHTIRMLKEMVPELDYSGVSVTPKPCEPTVLSVNIPDKLWQSLYVRGIRL